MPGRRGYPPEFRAEAVQLYRSSGKSIRDIAGELGISPESLRRWVVQQETDAGNRKGLTTEDREELGRLRKENHRLKMEREILKKATANSSGRCNNDFKSISRRLVTECLARARVETQSHRVKVSLTVA